VRSVDTPQEDHMCAYAGPRRGYGQAGMSLGDVVSLSDEGRLAKTDGLGVVIRPGRDRRWRRGLVMAGGDG
jgi:hypothetical protein